MATDGATFDIVVVGGGLCGSITALVLSRLGLRVLVAERSRHPRHAIGESLIPTSTTTLDHLARRYDIPEIGTLTRFTPLHKELKADFPKHHFWFGLHQPGEVLKPHQEALFETLDHPAGPDTHLLRAESDQWLAEVVLARYGVTYRDLTKVVDARRDGEWMRVDLVGEGDVPDQVRCRFVIDASGAAATFSRKLGYFRKDPPLRTHTRTVYAIFESAGMPDLDGLLGGPHPLYRHARHAGTVHHCFDGGWIWVIPFRDGTVSVGIVFDPRKYPTDTSVTAREEFFRFFDRYPTMKAHLGGLKETRTFVRTPRIQRYSDRILGDGVILSPYAAGFIDPLFSSGIAFQVTFIRDLAPLMKAAFEARDWSTDRFAGLEARFLRDLHHIDTIVAGTIASFRHLELFRQYWRTWVAGSMFQATFALVRRDDVPDSGLYGANEPRLRADVQRMWHLLQDTTRDPIEVAREMEAIMDVHWGFFDRHPFGRSLHGVGAKEPFKVLYKSTLLRPSSGNTYLFDVARHAARTGARSFPGAVARAMWTLFRQDVRRVGERVGAIRVDPERDRAMKATRTAGYHDPRIDGR